MREQLIECSYCRTQYWVFEEAEDEGEYELPRCPHCDSFHVRRVRGFVRGNKVREQSVKCTDCGTQYWIPFELAQEEYGCESQWDPTHCPHCDGLNIIKERGITRVRKS